MYYALKMMSVVFALGVLATHNIVQSANIIGCSNCTSNSYKSLGGEIIGGNLKEDEHLIFWDGFLETDELIITNKGIIKNSQFFRITDLKNEELCKFGIINFPSKLSIYADELANDYEGKRAKKRYFSWSNELSKRKLNLKKDYCKSTREAFINSIKIDAKYQCHTNVSACKIKIISFDKNRRISLIKNKYKEFEGSKFSFKNWTDERVCFFAANENKTGWSRNYNHIEHVQEAKKRKLDCGIKKEDTIPNTEFVVKEDKDSKRLAEQERQKRIELEKKLAALEKKYQSKVIIEDKGKRTITASNQSKTSNKTPYGHYLNKDVCYFATYNDKNSIKRWNKENYIWVKEAIRRGLSCGLGVSTKTFIEKEKNYRFKKNPHSSQTFVEKEKNYKFKNKLKPSISSAELEKERQKRKELERKLAALENKQKQVQHKIDTDTRVPLLEIISIITKGKRGTITGIARDNIEVAEVTVDGKPIPLSPNGKFNFSTYVPPTGKELKLEVTDIAGLTTSKVVKLKANRTIADSSIFFESLNPITKRVKKNNDALALIVGVSNYENTKAKALYADNDAMVFKDYAAEKLGISENRIKILLNDRADERDILLSVQEWLRRSARPDKSDIYIFFAGHGLASQDGKNMYLLPHDGSPRLLEKTAILRNELFLDIKQANPRSVTVFLDTCYSGVTRNEEMLIAGRPIVIKAKEQAIPDGFTLFSAASNEQISRPLEEAKHGMFSYFLMKGMEGDADANNDNKITARELHAYVEQNVVQQSSGSQTPELQGDKDRVLVQFN